jgi:exodeoxyribonuclease VII small subunit
VPQAVSGSLSEDTTGWTTPPATAPTTADAPAEDAADSATVGCMSFEQALAELEKIVQDLERGQLDLDAAIRAYERGTALKEHCQQKLQEARLRVERITLGPDGSARSEPLDLA